MKALVVTVPNAIDLVDREAPTPGDGEIVVRPVVVGMCGTDLEIIDGTIDQAYVSLPLTLGHEWAGVVVESPKGNPPEGARVVVEGIVPCGQCSECASGDTNRCHTYDEIGFTRHGAAAELIAVPANLAHVLADSVSFESGALVEPAAVVYRALDRVAPRPGSRVLVIGDGTVGLLAAHLVRMWEPAAVDVLGAREAQAPLAMAAGADRFLIDPARTTAAYDVVIEAAGVPAAAETAFAATARGGSIALLGLAGTGKLAALPLDDIVNGDIAIVGSFSYTRQAWANVVELLNAGRLDFDFLVTHRYDLDDWQQAIAALRNPGGQRGKVLLQVS